MIPIITAIGSAFKVWWDGRQKIQTAKIQAKIARIDAETSFQMKLAEIAGTWDLVALRQAQYSIKDEIIMLIMFAPLILWWIPSLRPEVHAWIAFVSGIPLWYQIVIFGIVAASFGLRWWFNKQGLNLRDKK